MRPLLPSSPRQLPSPRQSTRTVRSSATGSGAGAGATRISPVLLAPTTNRKADVIYRTTPRLPQGVSRTGPRPGIEVTQGLARLVSFPDNILSVFFSDPNVMDARAINARTIAVTGAGAGTSTLAVFTSRYPGDAVGRANIYRVQTAAKGGSPAAQSVARDPRALEAAINAALGDPRVRATVVRLPDGSLAGRLQGVVRNEAEVSGAISTASFYVPRVVSSLYADVNAPSIDAVRSGAINISPTDSLQDSLRRLTGNSSIELVTLPTGLALKAATDSPEEAEAILRILPSLNQPIVPFIVVRGLANSQSPYYNSDVPLLQGEDRQLTDKLQAVTGIRTVYAVRVSSNSVAVYGNVRTRGEYETVKRYGLIIAQQSAPIALQGTTQGGATLRPLGAEQPVLPAYDPAGGYARALGVQMFVRILDPSQATVRNVTVETNVVEISRTALRNLGVQFGSASVLTETRTPGTTTVLRDAAGNPVVNTNGSPATQTTPEGVTRTINPSLQQGIITAANGFIGGRPFQILDPLRAQLTALSNRGDARILARPNVSAMEGMSAQITIGGERPVPSAVATTGATAQSVEFRRYGVIISMRPTVSDDNTIILQIRADITQPDRTFEINLGGALIPGESVRSVDTTLAVRPGDVIVMGGLMTNEKRQQTSKVPILGDLPIIGALFKSKRYENNETELAIFMTPRIDFLPATDTTRIYTERGPALPPLPSRQESNGILFQPTTRAPG
jgi:Flp pilus assembly secretin CpaC